MAAAIERLGKNSAVLGGLNRRRLRLGVKAARAVERLGEDRREHRRLNHHVRLYSQLSSLISFGAGVPFPVSRSDFRLKRKTPHLVLQWCMNSTGSFQPWCLKRTMV